MEKASIDFGIRKVETIEFQLIPSERSLEAVDKAVGLHIIGRSKGIDLFPRTDKGENRCVLWQKYALINSRERTQKSGINLEQSSHIECICRLVRTEAVPAVSAVPAVASEKEPAPAGEEARGGSREEARVKTQNEAREEAEAVL